MGDRNKEHFPPLDQYPLPGLATHLNLCYPPVPCGVDPTYVGSIRTAGAGLGCPLSACSMEPKRLAWICCSCALVTLNCCRHSCTWGETGQHLGRSTIGLARLPTSNQGRGLPCPAHSSALHTPWLSCQQPAPSSGILRRLCPGKRTHLLPPPAPLLTAPSQFLTSSTLPLFFFEFRVWQDLLPAIPLMIALWLPRTHSKSLSVSCC